MDQTPEREHHYHAEATALSGEIFRPVNEKIEPQSFVKLPREGGYFNERSPAFRVRSVLSFESAYTQVAGNRELKDGHPATTLVTAVVEGLNVLDVVTADRVVAQISTSYPKENFVPSISFLGTRFDNLRIAGHEVKLDLDLDIFGDKPDDDAPYTRSPGFVSRVSAQHANIREAQGDHLNPLAELLERYNRLPESFANASGSEETVECSLVNQAGGGYPGHSCGHVIRVPDFGTVYLATIRLRHWEFEGPKRIPCLTQVDLTMLDLRLGCSSTATVQTCCSTANGTGKPNQPPPPPSPQPG